MSCKPVIDTSLNTAVPTVPYRSGNNTLCRKVPYYRQFRDFCVNFCKERLKAVEDLKQDYENKLVKERQSVEDLKTQLTLRKRRM